MTIFKADKRQMWSSCFHVLETRIQLKGNICWRVGGSKSTPNNQTRVGSERGGSIMEKFAMPLNETQFLPAAQPLSYY